MGPGVGPEGWLRQFAHPFGGAVCRGHAQYPAFASDPSEVAAGFLVSLYHVVCNLPQLHMHAVIFSPLQFLCILLLKKTFVQVQTLQQSVPGPRSQPVSGRLACFNHHFSGPRRRAIDSRVHSFFLFVYLFWLRWGFSAVCGLSLVAASEGYSSLQCMGFSSWWLHLLRSTGSRCVGFCSCGSWASVVVAHGFQRAGSVAVAHGPSRSAACGIFPDQGSNLCLLHWQADS